MVSLALGLLIAVLRLFIEPRLVLPTTTGSYEAFAHIFFGGCAVLWWQEFTRVHYSCLVNKLDAFFNRYFWAGMIPAVTELVMIIIQLGDKP